LSLLKNLTVPIEPAERLKPSFVIIERDD